ncbi:MAG TPA: TlpA disulfide reductase family protein [Acidimicrobiia bacterium]|nr:TlpA disulfide reductase family protein [Acidimicrobiia bacterium]
MNDTPDLQTTRETPPRRRGRWPLGTLTALVVAFVAIGVLVFGGDEDPGVTIPTLSDVSTPAGDVAPDFAIDLLDGTRFRLSDHLATDGRPVILNLWASWCGPCREEMPALDAVAASNPEIYLLGVAVDDEASAARRFAGEVGVSYALAIDEDDDVGDRYPSPGLPATFFIDRNRRVVKVVFGAVTQEQVEGLITELFG